MDTEEADGPPVTAHQARTLAQDHLSSLGSSWALGELYPGTAFPGGLNIYGGPACDPERCWVAYATERGKELHLALRSSTVVMIDRATGRVVYFGSANDEG